MANSTDTYWEVNGTSLQTYGWNITTSGGDLMSPPPLRGDDTLIPYRPGRVIQPRRPDSRSISFNMWVLGSDSDGRVPTTRTMRAQFERNLRALRDNFWNQGQPVTLTKRWYDDSGALQTASATALYSGGFAPSMQGSSRATFTVEMLLPDPFFYGSEVTLNFGATNQSTISPTILGDFETTKIVWTQPGSRTGLRLTNVSRGIYVDVNTAVSAGSSLVVDVDAYTSVVGSTNVIKSLSHGGHPFFMALSPGAQSLRIQSDSGSTAGMVKYRPAWL